MAKTASDSVEEFKPQNLANTADAFASMQHLSSPLFFSMSQQASLVPTDFQPQELVQFFWAFASMNHHPLDDFFDSLNSLVQKESFMSTSLFKNLS
jgi:predicted N-acyltransferase